MKFTIDKKTLADALDTVYPVCGKRQTLPILSRALLKVQGGNLEITGSDLDLTVKWRGEVKSKPGALAIPCARFRDIVKNCAGPEISIEAADGDRLKIESGSGKHNIVCLKGEKFPQEPKIGQCSTFTIAEGKLRETMRQVSWAIYDRDNQRETMSTICFQCDKAGLMLIATDGHCLAASGPIEIDGAFEFMLPLSAARFLPAVLGSEETVVKVESSQNCVKFATGQFEIFSRLAEGNYPNWKQVVPSDFKTHFDCDRNALMETVARAASVCSEKFSAVKMTIEKHGVTVSGRSEIGEASDCLDTNVNGDCFDIAFDPTLLRESLAAAPQDSVTLQFIDGLSPLKMSAPGWFSVIMPMRLT